MESSSQSLPDGIDARVRISRSTLTFEHSTPLARSISDAEVWCSIFVTLLSCPGLAFPPFSFFPSLYIEKVLRCWE